MSASAAVRKMYRIPRWAELGTFAVKLLTRPIDSADAVIQDSLVQSLTDRPESLIFGAICLASTCSTY